MGTCFPFEWILSSMWHIHTANAHCAREIQQYTCVQIEMNHQNLCSAHRDAPASTTDLHRITNIGVTCYLPTIHLTWLMPRAHRTCRIIEWWSLHVQCARGINHFTYMSFISHACHSFHVAFKRSIAHATPTPPSTPAPTHPTVNTKLLTSNVYDPTPEHGKTLFTNSYTIIPHIWMRYATRMKESSHTHESVMPHTTTHTNTRTSRNHLPAHAEVIWTIFFSQPSFIPLDQHKSFVFQPPASARWSSPGQFLYGFH